MNATRNFNAAIHLQSKWRGIRGKCFTIYEFPRIKIKAAAWKKHIYLSLE